MTSEAKGTEAQGRPANGSPRIFSDLTEEWHMGGTLHEFSFSTRVEVIPKWSQNAIQPNQDFQETPVTAIPPDLPPQITPGMHVYPWQTSVKRQQSTKHCSGDIMVENTKALLQGAFDSNGGGGKPCK